MLSYCRVWITVLGCAVTLVLSGQNDPVLFSVEELEVPVSEFTYIYEKNNRDDADYSRSSLEEYLDLYIKFKLKVKRALDLQLDTIEALQNELAGYRKQLAKSYMTDKEVTEKLAREAYDRMQTDLHISHILVRVDPEAGKQEEMRALTRAQDLYQRLQEGAVFAELARKFSDDKSSAQAGGDLGYITAMLPNGFYAMESAAYALEPGEISEPVRSPLGYHILNLHGTRPARGQVEAAHILVRVKADGSNEEAAEEKVEAIYKSLLAGRDFEELARSLSDDERTSKRGGYIGKFGINTYESAFEDAVFAMEEEGEFSKPVRTRVGWHIIKLIDKVELGSFEEERRKLEAQLARTERMDIARKAMIDTIKAKSGYAMDTAVLRILLNSLDETFLTFSWEIPDLEEQTLISFENGTSVSNIDFAQFLQSNTRKRMRAQHRQTPEEVARSLYEEYVDEQCLDYAEQTLSERYPEFAALMREYEEGIMLFEVTKMKVWDRANNDTAGLVAFHEMHREDYMWPERAEVVHYTVRSESPKIAQKARKLTIRKSPEEIVEKLRRKAEVTFQRKKYTRQDLEARGLHWAEGWYSDIETEGAESTFAYIADIIPATPRKLSEARGYVIADYQDQLEKEWVSNLRRKYRVEVNEEVFKSLIR